MWLVSEDTDNGEDNDADGEDDVKELMACDVLPVAMFSIWIPSVFFSWKYTFPQLYSWRLLVWLIVSIKLSGTFLDAGVGVSSFVELPSTSVGLMMLLWTNVHGVLPVWPLDGVDQ